MEGIGRAQERGGVTVMSSHNMRCGSVKGSQKRLQGESKVMSEPAGWAMPRGRVSRILSDVHAASCREGVARLRCCLSACPNQWTADKKNGCDC